MHQSAIKYKEIQIQRIERHIVEQIFTFRRFSTQHLWQWVSTHLAVESDAHSLYDPVVFDRCVKCRLHRLLICCSHYQLSVLCHQLSVGNPHDTELNLLDDPLFKGRNKKFLQKKSF